MKIYNCIVCGYPVERKSISKKIYCRDCAPIIKQIQFEIAHEMRYARIPPARGHRCVDCGAPASHREHRYYSRPLEVDYVCAGCNHKRGPALDIRDVVMAWKAVGQPQAPLPAPPELPAPTMTIEPITPEVLPENIMTLPQLLASTQRGRIIVALRGARGNRTRAARMLKITFRSMRYRMERLQIE